MTKTVFLVSKEKGVSFVTIDVRHNVYNEKFYPLQCVSLYQVCVVKYACWKKVKLVRGFLENFADIVIYVKFTVFFVGWRMFFLKFSDFYFAWIGFREHQFIFPRPQVTSNYLKANLSHFLKVNTFFSTHFPSHNLLIKRTLIPLFVKFFV